MNAAAVEFDLGSFLDAERRAVDRALQAVLEARLAGVPDSIAGPIRYAVEAGGKRLRPILCRAAYHAAGGRAGEPGIDDVACAVELIHTYSLMHDDLPCMDDDDLRRGRPSTHRAFDVPRATVAGAALIPLACETVSRGGEALGLTPHERAELVRVLCIAAGGAGMVGGQILDLEAEGRAIPLDQLEAIHARKTGALLAASLRLGGLAARAPGRILEALDAYGRALGLAFQITDDILDVTGASAVLGKTAGKDLDQQKATYPALLGLDAAQVRARQEMERAVDALRAASLNDPVLEALARFAVERDR